MTDEQSYELGQPSAAVICDGSARRSEMEQLARGAGYRLLAGNDLESLSIPPDMLLIDIAAGIGDVSGLFASLDLYLDTHQCTLIVRTDWEQLDQAYAALPSAAHIIVGADDAEALAILSDSFPGTGSSGVKEDREKADFVALHHMSGELASVAQRLADMAENARPPAPPLAIVPRAPPEPVVRSVTAADIRILIRRRRMRDQYFGAEMLADPAWDILLDLFASEMEEKDVSVSSLCIAAAVPPTTALRWISAMTEAGMLIRRFDPHDGRRVFISLSDDAATRMQQYFAAIGGGGAVI